MKHSQKQILLQQMMKEVFNMFVVSFSAVAVNIENLMR